MTDQSVPAEAGTSAEAGQTPAFTPEQNEAYKKQLRDEAKKYRLAKEAAEAKLAEIEKTQREAEAKRLQEEGQFKTLYEQKRSEAEKLAEQAKRAEPYVEAFREQVKKRIEAIPEAYRPLVPDFDDPLKTADWLDKNAAMLGARPFPNLNPGAGASTGSAGGSGTGAQVNEAQVQTLMKVGKMSHEKAVELWMKRYGK